MEFSFEELAPFSASTFLQISFEIPSHEGFGKNPFQKPFLLPNLSSLTDQEAFARVALCYSPKGLYVAVECEAPFQESFFPKVEQGDAVEIFIDTRDLKSVGQLHKFCHHFVFLPKPSAGITASEITKLRIEEAHPLADPALLHQEVTFLSEGYQMRLFIDKEALFGFEPSECKRLGFAYKIHRKSGTSQDFPLSTEEFQLEKYPYLWASLSLA